MNDDRVIALKRGAKCLGKGWMRFEHMNSNPVTVVNVGSPVALKPADIKHHRSRPDISELHAGRFHPVGAPLTKSGEEDF